MATRTYAYDDPRGFNFARPEQDGKVVVNYPFLQNGDTAAKIYTRSLVQTEASYVPIVPGKEKDSYWEGGDATAWNLPDTGIVPTGIGDLVRFNRSYARIPGTQVSYPGSRYFPIPTIQAGTGGSTLNVSLFSPYTRVSGTGIYNPDTGIIFTSYDNAVYQPTIGVSARSAGYATAGTFTVTFGANTTAALNWNDSGVTISAAINALASIISAGLTASVTNNLALTTGGYLGISWTVGTTYSSLTMNPASLTVTTSNNAVTRIGTTGSSQTLNLVDHLTVTGHGFNASNDLGVIFEQSTATSIQILDTGTWGVIDANTIRVCTSGTTGTYTAVSDFSQFYLPGRTYLLRTKVTETFYLPGVTPGITTAADIPTVLGLQNPDDFIDAILNLSGWQVYETEGPAFWLGGPIYRVATVSINLDDL